MNFPVSLDDLKQWWFGVSNPNTWQRGLDQLSVARNAISSAGQRIGPTGGSPIPGPPQTLSDVWHKLSSILDTPGKGQTQPQNRSGIQ